ncbi:MAG TPA: lysophospholipid acyltransferase family protein [Acidimicrobiia bacterium]|nr:lysophospholipid acyltransferase family protein [Acidimicrobiia bacterium]
MLLWIKSPFRTVLAITVAGLATWIAAWSVTFLAWRDKSAERIERVINWWARTILAGAGVTLSVAGQEHVDPTRSYVVVSNHQAALDIPAHFLALPVPIRFLAKKELFGVPILGTALRAIGIVEVDRQAGAAVHGQINSHSAEVIRRGHSILVYAEGTRFRDGKVHAFKRGAFAIAIDSGLPILPVMVHGGHLVWPQRRPIFGGPMKVTISEPIETSGLTRRDVVMLRDLTKQKIEEMVEAAGD